MYKKHIENKLIEYLSARGKLNLSYSKFFISFFLSLLLAFMVANTYEHEKLNNDILTYSKHFDCLKDDIASIESCEGMIGYPFDFLYEYVSYIFKLFFGFASFTCFVFVYSFAIYFSIIFLTIRLSSGFFLLSLGFLIVDFRFYELGNNVLRNGLALSLMLYVFHVYVKRGFGFGFGFLYKIFPSFAHFTAFPFVFFYEKIKPWYYYFILFVVSLFFAFKLSFIIDSLYQYLPSAIQGKLTAYEMLGFDGSGNYLEFPVHYLVFFSVVFLFFKKNHTKEFSVSFNVSFVFLMMALILNQFGVGYRFLNYTAPFLSIMISYYFVYIKDKFSLFAYICFVMLYLLLLLFVFMKNFDFIVRGF